MQVLIPLSPVDCSQMLAELADPANEAAAGPNGEVHCVEMGDEAFAGNKVDTVAVVAPLDLRRVRDEGGLLELLLQVQVRCRDSAMGEAEESTLEVLLEDLRHVVEQSDLVVGLEARQDHVLEDSDAGLCKIVGVVTTHVVVAPRLRPLLVNGPKRLHVVQEFAVLSRFSAALQCLVLERRLRLRGRVHHSLKLSLRFNRTHRFLGPFCRIHHIRIVRTRCVHIQYVRTYMWYMVDNVRKSNFTKDHLK